MVAPYGYKGDQWFSYDDEKSLEIKSQYVLDQNLGGVIVWSIDTDDFHGFCGRKNGLLNTLADVLNGGKPTPSTTTTTTTTTTPYTGSSTTTTITTTTSGPTTTTHEGGGHPICGTTSGIKPGKTHQNYHEFKSVRNCSSTMMTTKYIIQK